MNMRERRIIKEKIYEGCIIVWALGSLLITICASMWYLTVLFDFVKMYSTKEIYNQGNYNIATVVDYEVSIGGSGTKYYPIIRYQVEQDVYQEYSKIFDGKHLSVGEEILIYTESEKPEKFIIARKEYYNSIELFWEYTFILIIGVSTLVGPIMIMKFINKKESVKKESTKKKKKIKIR